NAPDGAPGVVGDQQSAGSIDPNSDWPTARIAVLVNEARDEIHRLADRLAAGEADEHDAVTVDLAPVPAAVLADEGAAAEHRGEAAAGVEGEAQRRDVRAKRVVGRDRLGDEVRALRLDPWVEMLAVVAVRPTVESTGPHGRHVV